MESQEVDSSAITDLVSETAAISFGKLDSVSPELTNLVLDPPAFNRHHADFDMPLQCQHRLGS